MEEPKENKSKKPAENKQLVKIRMRPGRAAEGVKTDKDGFALVDAKLAEHLVKINYAVVAEEK